MSEDKNMEIKNENMNIDNGENDKSTLKLSYVVQKCRQFYFNKITEEEFQPLLDEIYVNSYMPIYKKFDILAQVLTKMIVYIDDPGIWAMQIEMNKLWYLLLAYTNIDTTGEEGLFTVENYDILMQTISDKIQLLCALDYARLSSMMETTIDLSNIQNLLDGIAGFDTESLEKYSNEIKESMKFLESNPKMIKDLARLVKN